jgi:hypothetical protein
MNERIKQLYEQAHIERRQEYFSSVVDPTIKSVSVTRHFDPNLFAELIVRECANAADMAQDAGCEYAGDYVAEYMGYGQEEGVTEWRAK